VQVWLGQYAVYLRTAEEVIATALWTRRATVWSHEAMKEVEWLAQFCELL
jgi:hypothetical protein